MKRTRIRWRNAARLAAGAGAVVLAVGFGPRLLEAPPPPPLPADIGLASVPGPPTAGSGANHRDDRRHGREQRHEDADGRGLGSEGDSRAQPAAQPPRRRPEHSSATVQPSPPPTELEADPPPPVPPPPPPSTAASPPATAPAASPPEPAHDPEPSPPPQPPADEPPESPGPPVGSEFGFEH